MNKLIIIALLILIGGPTPLLAKEDLQATSTSREAGLIPGNFFYFADRFAENIKFSLTFNADSRARLSLEYAEERIAELSEKLHIEGIDSSAVAEARNNITEEIARAIRVVKTGKTTDQVVRLAKIVDQNVEQVRESLQDVYRVYHESLKSDEKSLRLSRELDQSTDAGLEAKLVALQDEILGVVNARDALGVAFEEEKRHLETSMGEEQSAESHIANALRARARFSLEMTKAGMATSSVATEALASFDRVMNSANESFMLEDFENASEYAKDALWTLNDARNEVETEDLGKIFFGEEDLGEDFEKDRTEMKGEPRGSR